MRPHVRAPEHNKPQYARLMQEKHNPKLAHKWVASKVMKEKKIQWIKTDACKGTGGVGEQHGLISTSEEKLPVKLPSWVWAHTSTTLDPQLRAGSGPPRGAHRQREIEMAHNTDSVASAARARTRPGRRLGDETSLDDH